MPSLALQATNLGWGGGGDVDMLCLSMTMCETHWSYIDWEHKEIWNAFLKWSKGVRKRKWDVDQGNYKWCKGLW